MKRTSILALLFAALCSASPAAATDLANVLVDYTLTAWGEQDGLPSSIVWAIDQDHEGYLWLGTDAGPVRFDGARFIPWEPLGPTRLPKAPVRALCTTRDGAIWFGFGDRGGVSQLREGRVRNYATADGLPEAIVTILFEDPAGELWAGTTAGLFRLRGERWQPAPRGLPVGAIHTIYADRAQRFLVGTEAGVFRLDRANDVFEAFGVGDVARGIAADRRGTLWVTDPVIGFRPLHESRSPVHPHEQGRGNRLITDADGNLWVGMARQGLWRIQPGPDQSAPRVEKTTALVGFSDDGVVSLFQDSGGNIWAGTLDGLNRLSPHKLTPVTDLGLVSGVETGSSGRVWVGTAEGVIEFRDGRLGSRQPADTLPALLSAMHTDRSGRLWVATSERLFRYDDSRRIEIPLPQAAPLKRIVALTSDIRGGIWVADLERGLLRWAANRLEPVALPDDVRGVRIVALATDHHGRVWATFANSRVALVDKVGRIVTYGRRDGLDAGVYRLVYEDPRGTIWLGGTEGLTRFAGGRFSTLRVANGFPTESPTGIVEDDAGYLWLGAEGSGIVRLAAGEVDKALANPAYRVQYRVFDKFDGFAGTARWFGNRGAVRTRGGQLWFVSGRGVTVVDPAALPEGPPAPARVRIEGVVADDARIPLASSPVLPARTNRVQIDYAVLNLNSPLRTRFRYRLDGFDPDWVEAGPRRQAFYTNLPPRWYVFRAAASNDDGSWSETPGVWAFTIAPAFYQTAWFFAVCLLGGAAIVGAAWRLHVRRVRKEFSLLLGERARLSREIHDTLLQGLFGVALRCESLARSLEDAAPWLQQHFLQMRKDIQEYIQEARQSIQDLRSPRLVGRELSEALRDSLARATSGTLVQYEVAVVGTPGCTANVEQQLLRIGQEAVANAVRHAGAHELRVELHYDDKRVRLRVADDGRGFDPSSVAGSTGHFGLAGMRERAESVGGTLSITTGAGRGAQIEAVVPRC